MLSKEEIEKNNIEFEIPSTEDAKLATKIYQVQSYIIDEIKEKGEISQFKEDVLYIIHNLLERQLNKQEQTACEIVLKNREVTLQKEKEQYLQNKLDQLETKNKELIEKLEKDIANITKTMQDGKHNDDYSRCRLKAYRTKTKEILSILKGENDGMPSKSKSTGME